MSTVVWALAGIWIGTIAGVIIAVVLHLLGFIPSLQTAGMTAGGWIVLGAAGIGFIAGVVIRLTASRPTD